MGELPPGDEEKKENAQSALVTVLLLLLALALHGVLEGLVIGTLQSSVDSLALVFAIVSHKPLEGALPPCFSLLSLLPLLLLLHFLSLLTSSPLPALSLGTMMIRGNLPLRLYVVAITLLALFTPIGIVVGMLLDSFTEASLGVACCYALAVGVFLYIATTEIIAEEISRPDRVQTRFAKLAAFLAGVTFIGALNSLLPLL
jgi:zinc transporter ZupT